MSDMISPRVLHLYTDGVTYGAYGAFEAYGAYGLRLTGYGAWTYGV